MPPHDTTFSKSSKSATAGGPPSSRVKSYADAILDRIVHNAHRINLTGHSLRRSRQQSTKGVTCARVYVPFPRRGPASRSLATALLEGALASGLPILKPVRLRVKLSRSSRRSSTTRHAQLTGH